MRITANQVTCARLLLLPLPVLLVYRERHGYMLAGLVAYILLGLTDAVDGWLARRQGTTALGALLDPIADKIFVVACFGPLADLGMVSLPLMIVLFVRELGVTALRSIALEENFSFQTSRVAKLKTGVQMGGAGFILLYWLFPRDGDIAWILGVSCAGALVFLLRPLLRRRPLGWIAPWALGLIAFVTAARLLGTPRSASNVVMAFITLITVLSGVEYAWGMRRVLAGRFRRSPIELARLLAGSLVLPFAMLAVLDWPRAPSFTLLTLLAVELGAGGVDNHLVQVGLGRGPLYDLARAGVQMACGLWLRAMLAGGAGRPEVDGPAGLALLYTAGDLLWRIARNRDAFRSGGAEQAGNLR